MEPQVVIEEETEVTACCWSGNVMAGVSDVVVQNHQQAAGEEAEGVEEMIVEQKDVAEVAAKHAEDAQSQEEKVLVVVSDKVSAVEERAGQTSDQNPPEQKPKQAEEGEPET